MIKEKATSYTSFHSWTAAKQAFRELFLLTKPGVTIVLTLTAIATALFASSTWVDPWRLFSLLAAGLLTAGGAASINQFLESDLDAKMPRTAHRPIPSGRLGSANLAFYWGLLLCGSGLVLAFFTLPLEAAVFMLLGILTYILLYTMLLKRRTYLNVVIGGLAGCFPVLAGWATVRADWPVVPFALAALVFFWTPAHFWAYAMAHVTDYQRAGFPMLPAVIGLRKTVPFIFSHAYLAVLASLIALNGASLWVGGAAGLVFLALCLRLWLKPGRRIAYYLYKASNYYLILIFLALLVS